MSLFHRHRDCCETISMQRDEISRLTRELAGVRAQLLAATTRHERQRTLMRHIYEDGALIEHVMRLEDQAAHCRREHVDRDELERQLGPATTTALLANKEPS